MQIKEMSQPITLWGMRQLPCRTWFRVSKNAAALQENAIQPSGDSRQLFSYAPLVWWNLTRTVQVHSWHAKFDSCSVADADCFGAFGSGDDWYDTDNDHVAEQVSSIEMRTRNGKFGKVFDDTFNTRLRLFFLCHHTAYDHCFEHTNSTKRMMANLARPRYPNGLKCSSALPQNQGHLTVPFHQRTSDWKWFPKNFAVSVSHIVGP